MIDSYEITADEDLVNEWRRAKGDLEVAKNGKGNICLAIPANLTIVKELVRRRIFPYHYEIYGVGFLELRSAFRSPWAFRKMTGLVEQLGRGLSNSETEALYEIVCRRVGLRYIQVIEFVLEQPKEKEEKDHHNLYKESFDKLVTSMDEARSDALDSKNF